MALNVNKQVVAVVVDTLCCIQYYIHIATHMQLYATFLQLISMSNSHTFQHGEQNANMAFYPFVDGWCTLIPFITYLQLFYD
jgi:hypothetical protein